MFDGDSFPVEYRKDGVMETDSDTDSNELEENDHTDDRRKPTSDGPSTSVSPHREYAYKHGHHHQGRDTKISPRNIPSFKMSISSSPPIITTGSPPARARSASMSNVLKRTGQSTSRPTHQNKQNDKEVQQNHPIRQSKSISPPRGQHLGSSPPKGGHYLSPPTADTGRPKSPSFRRRQYGIETHKSMDTSLKIASPLVTITPPHSPMNARRNSAAAKPIFRSHSPRPQSSRPIRRESDPVSTGKQPGSDTELQLPVDNWSVTISNIEIHRPRSKSFSILRDSDSHGPYHLPNIEGAIPIATHRASISIGTASSAFKNIYKELAVEKSDDTTKSTSSENTSDKPKSEQDEQAGHSLTLETVQGMVNSTGHVKTSLHVSRERKSSPDEDLTYTRRRSISFGATTARLAELRRLSVSKVHRSDENLPSSRVTTKQTKAPHPSRSDEQLTTEGVLKHTESEHSLLKKDKSVDSEDIEDEEDDWMPLRDDTPHWKKTNILKQSRRASAADALSFDRKFTSKYSVLQLENPSVQETNVFVIVHDDSKVVDTPNDTASTSDDRPTNIL